MVVLGRDRMAVHTHGVELRLTKLTPRPVVPNIHPEGTSTCTRVYPSLRLGLGLRLRHSHSPSLRLSASTSGTADLELVAGRVCEVRPLETTGHRW